jgi:chromosome partitioning protein
MLRGGDETMDSERQAPRPYVIVVGNEKGGTGKSTTAVNLAVALLRIGFAVGTIDLDARQRTLSRYLSNRRAFAVDTGKRLPVPEHRYVERAVAEIAAEGRKDETARLAAAFAALSSCQFIIVDTPGSDSHLSRQGHAAADALVTPINDSLVDIDVLAEINRDKRAVTGPSVYTRMVWEQNNLRIVDGRSPIDWVVLRNRLTHIDSRNKRDIADLLEKLADRVGFRVAPGLGERMVYRELFLTGLTVFDLPTTGGDMMGSSLAARSEIEGLLRIIGIREPVPA